MGPAPPPYAQNLLDNSNFANPVNQRKHTGYASSGYGYDRWYFYNTTSSLVEGQYTELSGNMIWQYLLHHLTGKPITAVLRLYDGTILCASGTVPPATDHLVSVIHKDFMNGAGLDVNLDTENRLQYIITIGVGSLKVISAELYEGIYIADNVPKYNPKRYEEELDECQRYCVSVDWHTANFFSMYGSTNSAGIAHGFTSLRSPMRITPSLSNNDVTKWEIIINGKVLHPTSVTSWLASKNNILGFNFTLPETIILQPCNIIYSGGDLLILSADL